MEKEEIHEQLNELSLELLTLAQNLVHCKVNLEKSMKEGYINMATARKTGTRVSSMQLPNEDSKPFEAEVKISSEECLRQELEVRFKYLSLETGSSGNKDHVESLDSELINRKSGKGKQKIILKKL